MIGRFPYKILLKYPHLRPEDKKIWELFISRHFNFYQSVDYDLKVGTGRKYPEASNDTFRKDMEYLSKKRIDVVGYKNDEIHIMELKPKAGSGALGQALSYAELYKDTFRPTKKVCPGIITDEEIPDIRDLCLKMGVLYLIA